MAGSRFAGHIRVWLLAAPLMLCVLAPMLPESERFEIGADEQTSVEAVLGEMRASGATGAANERFRAWFVDSGLLRSSLSGSASNSALSDAGASDLGRRWVRNFWMTIYRALYRAAVAHTWAFGAIVFLIAMLNDGAVARRIKASAAGFASPLSFHLAAHGLLVTFGIGASALLVPVPLLAYCWSAAALLVGVLGWRLAASFHVNR
ncbi:DUF4400 domain-containing protein [Cupriavidus basilensis]|uniref:DUF4400 domain-containing protein n=1 Tax=Cupriavidus basilensis TaxID=68895 RepID=UPI0020A67D2B|nr:DUF4400 domain-containing protein [Cupriavidus basilensis]MCP3018287.1 DUF4400 domain-containing protein [Cupriavidus basilensis]